MPFFVHKETGELHARTQELLEQVAQRVEQQGIEAWFSLDPIELLGAEIENYRKVTDTLDVWFDSGVSHACVLKQRADLQYPADLYLEGSDQHRGWFQSSLLTGCAIDGRAPYRALLTHGFVVDSKGHKMSKSSGNGIEPQEVMGTFGADILRLWVASSDYSGELSISNEILKRVVESYRRIRNTLRFLLANIADFDVEADYLDPKEWLEIDRYAIVITQALQDSVRAHYEKYEFHHIAQELQTFCSEDMGGFYLDILKDRLYTTSKAGRARRSAQSALHHIIHSLTRLIAPFLSFTAEEVWAQLGKDANDSVFLHTWHELPKLADAEHLTMRWQILRQLRSDVQKQLEELRVAGKIGSSLAAEVAVYAEGEHHALLNSLDDDLRFVFITSQASVQQGTHPGAIPTTLAGVSVLVAVSPHQKCERCWHYRADIGVDATYPGICGRCASNLNGQ